MGQVREPRVLHVMQRFVVDPAQRYLGSTKTVRCRTEYFQTRGIPYEELTTDASPSGVFEAIRQAPLREFSAIVFEHAHSPSALRWVRRTAPDVKIVLSTHNAEFLHRVDVLRADGLSKRTPEHLSQLAKKTVRDVRCARLSDYVLTLSEWEVTSYWARLIPRDRVRYVPWFLPTTYERELPAERLKKAQCVCLLSTIPNVLLVDAARNFSRAVGDLGESHPEWRFLMTGDRTRFAVATPARVQWTGLLDSPYEVLAESKAMALLSDYGYGFKTKILESILTRTRVLLADAQFRRLPEPIRAGCAPVSLTRPGSFAEALERSAEPLDASGLNASLRAHAFSVLDDVFGLTASTR